MRVGAVRAAPHVDVHDAIFARVEIVGNAEGRRNLDGPIARLEGRVAVEQFETELNSFAGGKLFRLAKKLAAAGIVSC